MRYHKLDALMGPSDPDPYEEFMDMLEEITDDDYGDVPSDGMSDTQTEIPEGKNPSEEDK